MVCNGPTCNTGLFARHPEAMRFLLDYDDGLIQSDEAINEGFQMLIDTGILWKLDVRWQTQAAMLHKRGRVSLTRGGRDDVA